MPTAERSLVVWLLLALVPFAGPAGGAGTVQRSITERIWERSMPSDSLRFDLGDRWIVARSVRATIDAETLRVGIDFEIETSEGLLRLLRPLPSGTLTVRYEVVPLAIGRVFQTILPPDTASGAAAPIPPRKGSVGDRYSRARLDLRGSKTISLEVGSGRDLTVRQSLDVSLAGEIAPGVTVRGVLSDRETPLQEEGRTTELSDLDRIYLQVEGPGASMVLGDFELRGPPGLFTGYRRQLEGILVRGRTGPGRVAAAAATLPGEYTSVEFLAEEGKQGPYHLRPAGASLDAVVLAGSEKVWLDGELLVRGEDRDYVIDYAAATLTFTGRRIVGYASRITVDLQVSSQPFRRNTYAAELGWGAGPEEKGGLSVRASLLTERDDLSRPVGGPLTDEEKQALREAGDSLTVALESGVDCRSPGYGPEHVYQLVEADSLDRPFFRYVGADSGSCRVEFDEVGLREGDYADTLLATGGRIYRFVGRRQGRFLPGRGVPRPSRRDLIDLRGSWRGGPGFLVEVEGAGSLDDPNTFSGADDSDRLGAALSIQVGRETLPIGLGGASLGRWGFTLQSRDLDPRFRTVGRIDPSWYGYDWGISTARLQNGDRRRSAEILNDPGFGFLLTGSYETLSNRRDLEGERTRFRLRRTGSIHGSAEHLRADTRDAATGTEVAGKRSVDDLGIGVRTARFDGGVKGRRDRDEKGNRASRTGSGFDEWSVTGAYLIPSAKGRFEVRRTERWDRIAAQEDWKSGDRSRTWEGQASWSPPGRLLESRYARRDLFRAEGSRIRSDLASLLWSQTPSDGRFSQQIRADLNTVAQEGRKKSIEYVGPGAGRYDSLGVYIGTGDYDLFLVPTGTTGLQRRLEASWRVDLAPGRGAETTPTTLPGRLWQSSSWLLYATFSSRTTGSAGRFWRDLPQLLLARKGGVPLAAHKIRAEVSALARARWASPELRVGRERSLENLFENVQTRRENDLVAFALRSLPAPGWTVEQELQADRQEEFTRRIEGSAASGAIGWRSTQLRLGGWWRPNRAWTARLSLVDRTRNRTPGNDRYRIVQLAPGIQWIPRERTRLDLRATRTWVRGPERAILGLEKPGWEGRVNLSVRLHGSLDASLVGDLTAHDQAKTLTNVRAELRALF